jgi:hypothetical protein
MCPKNEVIVTQILSRDISMFLLYLRKDAVQPQLHSREIFHFHRIYLSCEQPTVEATASPF